MTWIIGASSLFGYGVMLSDVRVTFPDGKTADIVRKAYPVGPYIVAGFAGSVFIGFRLLQSLQNFLRVPPDQLGEAAWKPDWVANHWGPEAKKIFNASPSAERKVRAHLLMVGVSPDEDVAHRSFGAFTSSDFLIQNLGPALCRRRSPYAILGAAAAYPSTSGRSANIFT